MNVRAEHIDDVLVLFLENSDALDGGCASAVKKAITNHIDVDADVILDLSKVEFMDSSGIAVLVSLFKRTSGSHRKAVFTGVRPAVLTVLELLRLDRIFVLRPDVDSAVGELSGGPAQASGQA